MNVLFEYLYRDAANYKNSGEVVLSITSGHELSEIERLIREELIDGTNFVAEDLQIPTVYFASRDVNIDHWWHEYSCVSWTDKAPTQSETIEEIVARLTTSRKRNPG